MADVRRVLGIRPEFRLRRAPPEWVTAAAIAAITTGRHCEIDCLYLVVGVLRSRWAVIQSIRRGAMPELWPEGTGWDEHSLAHATTHGVSADEIDEVIANGRAYRAYKRGRSADYLAVGVTDGGRRVVVAVEASAPARRTATPMSTRWTCPSTHFSSLAGQECRGGHRELDRIGTSAAGRTGIWEVQGNVVRDLACLNRVDPRLPVPTHYASFSGQRQP